MKHPLDQKYRRNLNVRARRAADANFNKKRNEANAAQLYKKDFVAIDCEGFSFGPEILKDNKSYREHRSFLWGAGDENDACCWLRGPADAPGLSTVQIFDWLLELPNIYRNAIFVAFAFGYDATQAMKDLPYEKAWEIQRGKPYPSDANSELSTATSATRRVVFWREYGVSYLKGKKFSLYKMRNPAAPYRQDKHGRAILDYVAKIEIFDVFGFFQSSFVQAANGMTGAWTAVERELVTREKANRADFDPSNIEEIKEYTRVELRVLARMMGLMRKAMLDRGIKLRTWFGAGSIAQALIKMHNVKQHFYEVRTRDLEPQQTWAHHAYFGGRIELLKQGYTPKKLYGYDISSAYPYIATTLPSMQGGYWKYHGKVTANQLATFSALSIVEIETHPEVLERDAPFYPFPYRMPNGAILFPRKVRGFYMCDEVRAGLEWQSSFKACGYVELYSAWEFVVQCAAAPFDFIREIFHERSRLAKTDITQIVLKLGMNSCYGKLAQAVGSGMNDKPPSTANPWYAAAITAGTRAQLMRAALQTPEKIVMFATDGIISETPLDLDCPATKTLGAWEDGELPQGGVFVQSGVYAISSTKGYYSKTRGFRPANLSMRSDDLGSWLVETIPPIWSRGDTARYEFDYRYYVTLGAAIASRETFEHIGQWGAGVRNLDLDRCGVKRVVDRAKRRQRGKTLLATRASCANEFIIDDAGEMPVSMVSKPEWLDFDGMAGREVEIENSEIMTARYGTE